MTSTITGTASDLGAGTDELPDLTVGLSVSTWAWKLSAVAVFLFMCSL